MNHLSSNFTFLYHDQLLLWATQKHVSAFTEVTNTAWQKCIEMAHYHAVIPQLQHALKHNNISIPQTFMIQLESLQRNIALENMTLAAELINITKQFDKNKLPYLSIKGPALSQSLYQDVTTRQICDLDILVDEKDLIHVSNILIKQGYRTELPYALLKNDGFLALDNDFTFLHHQKKIMIELHWKLFPSRHHMPLDFEMLYHDHTFVTLQKHDVKVLSNENNLLYLCLHASKHLFEQLKWLCDIDRLIRDNPNLDFSALYTKAQTLQVQESLLLALLMSQTLYSTPLPSLLDAKITPKTVTLLKKSLKYFSEDFTTLEEGTKKRLRLLFLQDLNSDKQNKFIALFIYLFKPTSVDYIYYNLQEKLNFLYPFLRPLRLLKKYLFQGKI